MKKSVLVTGGASGIGLAISEYFLQQGFQVFIQYNESIKSANDLKNSSQFKDNIFLLKANLLYEADIFRLVEEIKKYTSTIDVLVNNAGKSCSKLVNDITSLDFDEIINLNLKAPILLSKEILNNFMLPQKNGSIINIASIWGLCGSSMESLYSASKGGLIAFTKSIAKEVGPSNIRVNAVCPGVIKTKMLDEYSKEDLDSLAYDTPLERIGTPYEVAKSVYFLASDESSFITGEVLNVSGGFVI